MSSRAASLGTIFGLIAITAGCGGGGQSPTGAGGAGGAGSSSASTANASTSSASTSSGMGTGGGGGMALPPPSEDEARDLLSTSLKIDLSTLHGTAIVSMADAKETGASFEVEGLTIQSVKDANGPLNYAVAGGKRLDVGVPSTGMPPAITIDYTFKVENNFDGWLPQDVTFIWPYFCGNLFPCKSDPADGLTFNLEVTGVPAGKTAVYPTSIPSDAPSYMLAFAVGDYTYLDLGKTKAGTDVGVYYLGNNKPAAQMGTAHLTAAFDWYEQNLGPYRFGSKVASVEAAWGPGAYGGMEHHPLWHVGSDSMSDEETHAHEAAHGWFGDGVRIKCWEDFVLSEGTVSYLAARSLAAIGGIDVWPGYQSRLDAAEMSEPKKIARPDGCDQIDILKDLFTDIPYMKGAFFYRAVELKVGAMPMIAALSAFYKQYQGKAAGLDDMIAVIKATTGYDATACAQAWLKSDAVPAMPACQ